MSEPATTPLHAFLSGRGVDGRGRTLDEVLDFDDDRLERVHDFIQWLFPLREASRAVPDAPILSDEDSRAIRDDPLARDGLRRALDRMTRFYRSTDAWLTVHDHNHLRITRILTAARQLLDDASAQTFHEAILRRNEEAGRPIGPTSLAHWSRALGRS